MIISNMQIINNEKVEDNVAKNVEDNVIVFGNPARKFEK